MSKTHLQEQCKGFLNTPPLWQNEQFGIQQFKFPEIDLSDFIPEAIPAKIRLGHQIEYVFKQLVAHSRQYEILLHNLPVKNENRTIGEIDFILRDAQTNNLVHIELTYKFYIVDSEITKPVHRLIGPNRRDMFSTKMEKIKNEQFKLIHSKEGCKALYERNIDHKKINHETCFKGQLFIPRGSEVAPIRPLNDACICGYWLAYENFKSIEFKEYQFYIPLKSQWVIEPNADVEWRPHFETLPDINLSMHRENAPMVWMKKSETEFEKFFVVWW